MIPIIQLSARAGLRCVVVVAFLSAVAIASAETFITIKSFGILTNVSGFNSASQLVQGPDGTLYGTTTQGEGNVRGTIFKVQPDGTGFTALKWFTNSLEGDNHQAGLTLSGSTLYGSRLRVTTRMLAPCSS